MTVRDDVWDEVMTELVNHGKVKISDMSFTEEQRHSVRRTLREMEEKGWVRRDSPQAAIWRLGPKAELILDIDDEVRDAARS